VAGEHVRRELPEIEIVFHDQHDLVEPCDRSLGRCGGAVVVDDALRTAFREQ